MGASFDMRVLSGDSIEEITHKWNELVDADLQENGHSYSGSIGMLGFGFELIKAVMFDTPTEADEFISENQDKWSKAIAVQIKTSNNFAKGKIILAIGGWCSS